jgi:hypothetical protein
MLDQTYNERLRTALVGRVLREEEVPPLVQGERVLSLWGEDAGIPDWDIHATRAYRIYLDLDEARTIGGIGILVDGELLSPCCGYALEALDEQDFPYLRDWCLAKLEPVCPND